MCTVHMLHVQMISELLAKKRKKSNSRRGEENEIIIVEEEDDEEVQMYERCDEEGTGTSTNYYS